MSDRVEPLPWDTDFFGVAMGRVALDDATPALLDAIDDEARDPGITCLTGYLDPTRSDAARLVQDHGHLLVEGGLYFDRPAIPLEVPPTPGRIRPGRVEDLDVLATCIAGIAPWSRFAVDPRFGVGAAHRLYEAWIRRAASDETDTYGMAVVETEGEITGFVTYQRAPEPLMDLLVVLDRGSGTARALLDHVLRWADRGGALDAGPAAVRNVAIMRYLNHCDFRVTGARTVFHRWYGDP